MTIELTPENAEALAKYAELAGQSLWRWKAGEIEDSITPTPGQKTRSFATYAEFESQ